MKFKKKIFSSENTEPISTKLCWNDSWMVPFQNCVRWSRLPTKMAFGLIWFSGFRGEDLNVIFYQNMPNLHNRYISGEWKISQKNPEYMLNYFLPCRDFLWTLNFCQFSPIMQIRKEGGWNLKKKSSPLKILSQSQPNFAEMILCSCS
jgi:hypothetical protein